MSWSLVVPYLLVLQAVAGIADVLLKRNERTALYDRMLAWWLSLESTQIPELPRLAFRKVADAVESWLPAAKHRVRRTVLLCLGAAVLAGFALAVGSYIDWSEGNQYVPVSDSGWLQSNRTIWVGIKPVSFSECLAAVLFRRIGLLLVVIAIPCYILALFLFRSFTRVVAKGPLWRRTIFGFVLMFLTVQTAAPLSFAGEYIGLQELLFTTGRGGEGTAIILYCFAGCAPAFYVLLVTPVMVLARGLFVIARGISVRILGGTLEVPIHTDLRSFRPFSVLAAAGSVIIATGNAIARSFPGQLAVVRATVIGATLLLIIAFSTVWLLASRRG